MLVKYTAKTCCPTDWPDRPPERAARDLGGRALAPHSRRTPAALAPHSRRTYVTLAPRLALKQDGQSAEAAARGLLDRFGLSDKVDAYPDHLSGGQQQRVAIVRALAMQPQLMLLDEVTSALDPELVAEVLEVIGELAAGGMTMVIATHEMGFAREIATRVCFLDAGRILEQGPPAQIFGEPREARTQQFLQRIVDAKRL